MNRYEKLRNYLITAWVASLAIVFICIVPIGNPIEIFEIILLILDGIWIFTNIFITLHYFNLKKRYSDNYYDTKYNLEAYMRYMSDIEIWYCCLVPKEIKEQSFSNAKLHFKKIDLNKSILEIISEYNPTKEVLSQNIINCAKRILHFDLTLSKNKRIEYENGVIKLVTNLCESTNYEFILEKICEHTPYFKKYKYNYDAFALYYIRYEAAKHNDKRVLLNIELIAKLRGYDENILLMEKPDSPSLIPTMSDYDYRL